jgi:hypothetical protein
MKTLILSALIASSAYASSPVLLSERYWQGEYIPSTTPPSVSIWSHDIKTSTIATQGNAWVNELIYGWAIFRIHVHPAWGNFECSITKQVCMNGNRDCENLTQNYLFIEEGILDDDKSWRAGFIYPRSGEFPTSSHVYMDRCGGNRFNSSSTGKITVKQKEK